jgi:hypothetical protein
MAKGCEEGVSQVVVVLQYSDELTFLRQSGFGLRTVRLWKPCPWLERGTLAKGHEMCGLVSTYRTMVIFFGGMLQYCVVCPGCFAGCRYRLLSER